MVVAQFFVWGPSGLRLALFQECPSLRVVQSKIFDGLLKI
jgi:hypothetical protein